MDEHERALRRLRLEDRARREDIEAAEAELDVARRTLLDEFADFAQQGVLLSLEIGGHVLRGRVHHVGASVVGIVDDLGKKHLVVIGHLDGVRVGANDSRQHCAWSTGHPGSMVAALREQVGSPTVMLVERRTSAAVVGSVSGVSDDHVRLVTTAGAIVIVPMAAITSMSPR